MKKSRLLWAALSLLIILTLVLSACTQEQTSTSTTSKPATTTSKTTMSSSTTTTSTTSATSTTQANWWDKFGEPVYGGEIVYATGALMGLSFDLYNFAGAENDLWYESLFEPSWTVDRQVWSMTGQFYPDEYWQGNLAETWAITTPTTITAHLRQGVHWQNKAPVNGREFTAEDVVYHYDRMLGTGSGFSEGNPMYLGMAGNLANVTSTDQYTVVFNFKQPSAQNFQTIADRFALNQMDAREWVELAKDYSGEGQSPLADWTTVVGTGAWILTDLVSGSSFNYVKNPDYWAEDERHPGNKLPYADKLTMLIIPDSSTRLAALRTGQIDTLTSQTGGLLWQDAQQITKTNPDMQMAKISNGASGIGLRVDQTPFDDIKVRIALDMSVNREAIASGFYGGTSDTVPVGMITGLYQGYAYAYEDWSQSLKDEYAYNPDKAIELLAEAGYPDGFSTKVVASNEADTLQLLQIFKSYFADIGVEMVIDAMDPITYQSLTRGGKHDQMSSQGLAFSVPPTRVVDTYYSKTLGDCVFYGLNNAPDSVYDDLRDQFMSATDAAKAREILQQMDKRVIEQHFNIAAPESYSYMVWQSWLKGYSGEVIMWGGGVGLARLWKTK